MRRPSTRWQASDTATEPLSRTPLRRPSQLGFYKPRPGAIFFRVGTSPPIECNTAFCAHPLPRTERTSCPTIWDMTTIGNAWSVYQESVADFFRNVGFGAETNVTVTGTRTQSDIDVVVRGSNASIEFKWLIECKSWQSRVTKEKVFALRAIVSDIGADRGFIMAENGYQSGAYEAAKNTNITLSSLAELAELMQDEIATYKLKNLLERTRRSRGRYWAIGKSDRIRLDLRPDITDNGYNAIHSIGAIEGIINRTLIYGLPLVYDRLWTHIVASSQLDDSPNTEERDSAQAIRSLSVLAELLECETSDLEGRLAAAEETLRRESRKRSS